MQKAFNFSGYVVEHGGRALVLGNGLETVQRRIISGAGETIVRTPYSGSPINNVRQIASGNGVPCRRQLAMQSFTDLGESIANSCLRSTTQFTMDGYTLLSQRYLYFVVVLVTSNQSPDEATPSWIRICFEKFCAGNGKMSS